MKNIIKVDVNNFKNNKLQCVNARDLHWFLESKQDFSNWIKSNLNYVDAVKNEEYIRFNKKIEANNATMIEYIITLDIAKEIALLQRSQKGKEIRKYFIEIEKEFRKNKEVPGNFGDALLLAWKLYKEKEMLELENKKLESKNEDLTMKLDENEKYATVKKIKILTWKDYKWKPLKDYCKLHDLKRIKVPDQNYSEVWSYPVEAWRNVYKIL